MNWEEQWKSNQSQFGVDSQINKLPGVVEPRKINIPLLAAGVVGLITTASIVSSVVTSVSSSNKAKKEHHKHLARRAGWYVK